MIRNLETRKQQKKSLKTRNAAIIFQVSYKKSLVFNKPIDKERQAAQS